MCRISDMREQRPNRSDLGKDEYFLLGDNETASDDSREEKIGNIKKKEIYGEVWFVIKPWSDIGFVSD
ncbi:hypothetical protein Rumi1_15530 [[Ruminococcus] torques]|nr:hypothetical protein Rumi1_15530 [[Ruminococcus] torques]